MKKVLMLAFLVLGTTAMVNAQTAPAAKVAPAKEVKAEKKAIKKAKITKAEKKAAPVATTPVAPAKK